MAGLCSPLHRSFSITLRMRSQAGREQEPLSPGTPRTTFVREPPGWWDEGPAAQRLHPDTARIDGSSGTGAARGKSSPSPANRTGIQGRERAAAPGRPRLTGGRWRFPTRPGDRKWGLLSARCSGYAARMQPCGAASALAHRGMWNGEGHLDMARVVVPKLPALHSTLCVPPCSLHTPLHAEKMHGSALSVSAQEPSHRREVTGVMPGALEELGLVSITANTGQGRWRPCMIRICLCSLCTSPLTPDSCCRMRSRSGSCQCPSALGWCLLCWGEEHLVLLNTVQGRRPGLPRQWHQPWAVPGSQPLAAPPSSSPPWK